jgi:hypothetical protein
MRRLSLSQMTARLTKYLTLLLLLVTAPLRSAHPVTHAGIYADPISTAIKKLQPKLSEKAAREVARVIRTESKASGIAWQLLVSIAFHESSLGLSEENSRSRDYGLMQINVRNIQKFGYTTQQVLKDRSIAVKIACRILKSNREAYSLRYPFWLGLYRSGTALTKKHIRENAQSYDRMIRKTAAVIGYQDALVGDTYGQNN